MILLVEVLREYDVKLVDEKTGETKELNGDEQDNFG